MKNGLEKIYSEIPKRYELVNHIMTLGFDRLWRRRAAAIAVEAVDVSATIVAINKKKRTITLKGPDGKKVTTKVNKSVKSFDTLKVGDSINARYTEAIAISVEKP